MLSLQRREAAAKCTLFRLGQDFALSTPHTGQVSEFPFPLFLELGAFSQYQRYGLAFKALTDEQFVTGKGTRH